MGKIIVLAAAMVMLAPPCWAGAPAVSAAPSVCASGSTTCRTPAARAADIYNVLDNGLKGDCASAEQTALAALMARASAAVAAPARARIDFPVPAGGCYALTSTLEIPSNLDLNPLGMVVIRATGASGALVTLTNESNVRIGPFVFDQQYPAVHASVGQAVSGTNSHDVTIERLKVVNPTGSILFQGGSYNLHILSPDVQNGLYHGVSLTDVFDSEVLNGNFQNLADFGIILTGTTHNVLVEGNHTARNGIELVGLTKGTYQNRIIGNHAAGTGDNCFSISGHETIAMGNEGVGCAGNGIEVYGDRNTVVGNYLKNNAQGYQPWVTGLFYNAGARVQSGGNLYAAVAAGTSGATAPTGTGTASDGSVSWIYQSSAANPSWLAGIVIQGAFGGMGQHNIVTGNTTDDDQAIKTQKFGVYVAPGTYGAWNASTSYAAGAYAFSGLNLYQAGSAGTSGTVAPSCATGSCSDGAITWTYLSSFDTDTLNDFNTVYPNNNDRAVTAKLLDASTASGNQTVPYTLPAAISATSVFNTGGIASIALPVSATYQWTAAALAGNLPTCAVAAPASGTPATCALTTLLLYGYGTVSGGAGCSVNDVLTIPGGSPVTSATNLAAGVARTIKVTAVDGNGAVTGRTAGPTGSSVYAKPWTEPVTLTGGTCTSAPTMSGSSWQLAIASTVTSAGSGYAGTATASYSPSPGTTSVATSAASFTASAGAGAYTADNAGSHVQAAGADVITAVAGIATITGHLASRGTSPALSSCGTSPALSGTATDAKGTVTEGTSAMGCTLTFAAAYASAPDCTVSTASGTAPTSYAVSTTALTVVNASASGNRYSYACQQ